MNDQIYFTDIYPEAYPDLVIEICWNTPLDYGEREFVLITLRQNNLIPIGSKGRLRFRLEGVRLVGAKITRLR